MSKQFTKLNKLIVNFVSFTILYEIEKFSSVVLSLIRASDFIRL